MFILQLLLLSYVLATENVYQQNAVITKFGEWTQLPDMVVGVVSGAVVCGCCSVLVGGCGYCHLACSYVTRIGRLVHWITSSVCQQAANVM